MPHINPLHAETVTPANYSSPMVEQNLYNLYYPSQSAFKDSQNILLIEEVSNIEQDYIDLFSYKRKGHMTKYIHLYRPDIYDAVIQQDSFYPFKMECDLLEKRADQLLFHFLEIMEAIEIGPGSAIPVTSKTIPFVKKLQSRTHVDTYKAMDINIIYAQQACQLVQKQLLNIKAEAIEIDFLSREQSKIISANFTNRKKIIFGLGQSVISNNTDNGNLEFLHNISLLLGREDFLLFGVDTNRDAKILEKAYNTNLFYELLLNTMYYLKNKLYLADFNPEAFELVYRWNPEENIVNLLLKPTYKQVIKINNQILTLHSNQEFHISSSRKFNAKQINEFLDKSGLRIKDIVVLDNNKENKFSMIVAQKYTSSPIQEVSNV